MKDSNRKHLKLGIVGAANSGKTYLPTQGSACIIDPRLDLLMVEPEEPLVFTIHARPPLPDVWVDPSAPVFNQAKHQRSCTKNRRKRKKKKQRS